MKKLFLLIVVVVELGFAGAQQILQKTYDNVNGSCMVPTGDAGYLISGTQDISGRSALLFFKLDSMGNQQWSKTFSDTLFDVFVHETIQIHNGDFLTAGGSYNTSLDVFLNWILKTDSAGNFIYAKAINSTIYSAFNHISEDQFGNIICAGRRNYDLHNGLPPESFFLMKLDSNLNVIWAKEYPYVHQCYFTDIAIAADGNYILQGYARDTTTANYRSDMLVFKTDTSGNLIWVKQCGNKPNSIAGNYGKLDVMPDGTMINAFKVAWYNGSNTLLQKLDLSGNELLSRYIAHPNPQSGITPNDFVLYKGGLALLSTGNIFKLDSVFNSVFTRWVLPFWPSWLTYGVFRFDINASGGFDMMGFGIKNNLSKLLYFKTDSLAQIGCGGLTQNLINQPDTVPSIDITNLLIDSFVTVTDSILFFNQDTVILNDSIYCLTATNNQEPFSLDHAEIKVYPTITTGSISVVSNEKKDLHLKVIDVTGKILIQYVLYDTEYQLDLKELNNGMYFISIETNSVLYTFKIIKQ